MIMTTAKARRMYNNAVADGSVVLTVIIEAHVLSGF